MGSPGDSSKAYERPFKFNIVSSSFCRAAILGKGEDYAKTQEALKFSDENFEVIKESEPQNDYECFNSVFQCKKFDNACKNEWVGKCTEDHKCVINKLDYECAPGKKCNAEGKCL